MDWVKKKERGGGGGEESGVHPVVKVKGMAKRRAIYSVQPEDDGGEGWEGG